MYENYVASAGLEMVAENTGALPSATPTTSWAASSRIAEESSTYYLLGYQPDKAPDGKWHKLEVKVARPGLKVRTRRGYQAAPAPALVLAPPVTKDKPGTKDKKSAKEKGRGPSGRSTRRC